MLKKLRKIFIPHESNNYHPHSTRYSSIFFYALLLLVLNYLVFPALGIQTSKAYAANINPQNLIELENTERESRGLSKLTENPLLKQAAELKGKDMLQKQYWSHFGPSNETPWQFIKEAGYSYVYAGENLAKDFYSDIDVHTAWMESESHRANILNKNFNDIGIAVVSGEFQGYNSTIIVVMFGSNFDGNNDFALKAPQILSPESGTALNSNSVTIEGSAESGDTLKVFSNGKLIGELPKGGTAFTVNVELLEKENQLYIKSKDSKSGRESQSSNNIELTVAGDMALPQSSSLLGATTFNTNQKFSISKIFTNFKQFPTSEKINFGFIFFISTFVFVDLVVLVIKGIKRDTSSHHSFHFALIMIVSIGILTL